MLLFPFLILTFFLFTFHLSSSRYLAPRDMWINLLSWHEHGETLFSNFHDTLDGNSVDMRLCCIHKYYYNHVKTDYLDLLLETFRCTPSPSRLLPVKENFLCRQVFKVSSWENSFYYPYIKSKRSMYAIQIRRKDRSYNIGRNKDESRVETTQQGHTKHMHTYSSNHMNL